MNKLSNRVNRLAPSATLAMSQKSQELKAQGVDVINMSVGEPDFNTPDAIKEAGKQAIEDNWSRYSPVPGYPALRKAIVEKLKRENGLEFTEAQISVSNGAKQAVPRCSSAPSATSWESGRSLSAAAILPGASASGAFLCCGRIC